MSVVLTVEGVLFLLLEVVFVVTVDDKNLRLVVVVLFFLTPTDLISPKSSPSLTSCHHESNKALQQVVFPIPAKPATMIFNETIRGLNFNDSGDDPIEFVGISADTDSGDDPIELVGISVDTNSGDSVE